MISVYLAGRYSRREELARVAADLRRDGIAVTSRWLDGSHSPASDLGLSAAESERFAVEDLDDIDNADVLVWFAEPADNYGVRGGAVFEAGYAYGTGAPLVIVGHRQTVFSHLPDVVFAPDAEAAKSYLRSLRVNSSGRVRRAA